MFYKRNYGMALHAIILFSFALPLFAAQTTVNGITWTYTVSNGEASLGGGSSSSTAIPTSTKGVLTIPSTLGGYPVTRIGSEAFYNCSGLTSVTIPDSVMSIGWDAFSGCIDLMRVTIPNSVTSIGSHAFYGCSVLESVTIPSSVTSIGEDPFYYCPSWLFNTTTIAGVKLLDGWVFGYNTYSLSGNLDLTGVRGIAASAFRNCSKLTSVTIPDSLTRIESGAFSGCTNLTSVTIPESVTSIGNNAFYNCSSLTSVTIPDSVTSIGGNAFYGCNVKLFDTRTIAGVKLIDGWAVGTTGTLSGKLDLTGVRGIADSAFLSCSELTSVTIPDSVTCIARDAFYNCFGLKSVTIPDSVTSIGSRAFSWCSGLTNVTFYGDAPDGILESAILSYAKTIRYPKRYADSYAQFAPEAELGGYILLSEDEFLNIDGADFVQSDDGQWVGVYGVSHDNEGSLRSGGIGHGESTWIETSVTGAVRVSFWWKASSEGYDGDVFDYAYLSVDGVPQGSLGEYKLQGVAIGGKTGWTNVVFDVMEAGPHTIRWTYCKDEVDESDVGSDCVWLDEVSFDPLVSLSFTLDGGEGTVPDSMAKFAQTKIVLPAADRFSKAKHRFGGWSDGVNTYGAGAEYVVPDSNVVFSAAWAANTLVAPVVTSADVADGGTLTKASATIRITAEAGASIHYTTDGSEPMAESALYTEPFTTDGQMVMIRAVAVKEDYFDSPVTEFSFTRKPFSVAECLNVEDRKVSTGDEDTAWFRVLDAAAHDGEAALRSGVIGDSGTSSVEMTVRGAGEISFWWKVSSEISRNRKYDYVSFLIDGEEQSWLGGEMEWTNEVFAVSGEGAHTLKWVYQKNDNGLTDGEDCAWLDEVTWMPVGGDSYFVEFDACGGEATLSSMVLERGSALGILPEAERPCYEFVGWHTAANGGTKVTAATVVTGDVTYYAHWQINSYTVMFDLNGAGGAAPSGRSVEHGAAVGALPDVTYAGYFFAGWYTAAEGGTKISAATTVTADVTYYAHWRYVGAADDSTIVFNMEETYETEADGSLPLNLSELVGSTSTPKLTVKGLPTGLKFDAKTGTVTGKATKPGTYKVTVSATNATVKKPVTATFEISVPNLTCAKLPNLEPGRNAYGTIRCGVAFNPAWVDCTPEKGWTVKVAGLPAGLKYDAKTGKITGVPTKAGTFTVTFTASKKGEANQVATITLETAALPDWAQGTFTGYVKAYGGAPGYEDDFGFATMTVAANGKISGKLSLRGANWAFGATGFAASDGGDHFEVESEAKAGKTTMPVTLLLQSSASPAGGGATLLNASVEGSLGGSGVAPILLWRNVWKDKATAAAAKAEIAKWEGVYTVSAEDGGYLSLTVGKDGTVKASGKLSDGTSVSASAPLMYHVFKDFFTVLCAAPSAYKGGHVWLPVGFGTARGQLGTLGESLVVCSRNPQASGEYGAGFTRQLGFTGAFYNKTKKLNDYYDALRLELGSAPILPYSQKITYLDEGGKKKTATVADTAYAVDTLWQDGLTATFDTKDAPVVAKATKPVQDKETKEWFYNGTNDGAMSLSFAQATGIFKGSYTFWYDYMSAYDETTGKETKAHTSKKVNFEGIMVQGEESLRGFYLWDASSSYDDPKTGKSKTYKYKESHSVILSVP